MISNKYLIKRHWCGILFYAFLFLTLLSMLLCHLPNENAEKMFTILVYIFGTAMIVTGGVYNVKFGKKKTEEEKI